MTTENQLTFTDDQVALLRSTICPEATPDELALFIQRCKSTGLDPFANQIYLVKRSKTSPATMQTGIDGFRLVAQRTGERDGQDAPEWCGEDGVFKPIWTGKTPPLACRLVVYRKGHTKGYPASAYWEFYAQKKSNGELNNIWSKGAAHMLCKCAEALALRMAFPNELSGLYTSDEMAQADVQHNNLLAAPTISYEDAKAATKLIERIHPLDSKAEVEKLLPDIMALERGGQIMVKPTYAEKLRQLAEEKKKAAAA